jgi:hypothetical protein
MHHVKSTQLEDESQKVEQIKLRRGRAPTKVKMPVHAMNGERILVLSSRAELLNSWSIYGTSRFFDPCFGISGRKAYFFIYDCVV